MLKKYRLKKRALVLPLILIALLYAVLHKQEPMTLTHSHYSTMLPDLTLPLQERLEARGVTKGDSVFIRIFKEEGVLELWMRPHRQANACPATDAAGQPDDTTATNTTGQTGITPATAPTGQSSASSAEFRLFAVYPICAMSGTLGPKLKQGDKQAPEGFYAVGLRQFNPNSRFHLSFNIGYPNSYDRAHGRTGDFIMVHGNCVSAGCFAMTDRYIEEIYGLAEAALLSGQPFFRIHIFPFRLDRENLERHADSVWAEFWQMLKPGYDYFEQYKTPPDIIVRDKKYLLSGNSED
ncbi:murein L,D-transpeptidase [Desulfovibrio sp. OttesenSCG-928-C06]|nr:murein L,D-transpeptidase [Desulfovibrio sp. OttesenSCG-928-C06]